MTLPPEIHQIIFFRQWWKKLMDKRQNLREFLGVRKVLNSGLKSGKQLQTKIPRTGH